MASRALVLATLASCGCSRWREPFDKGVAAYQRGAYREAAADLEQAVAANPGSVEIRVYLANSYLKQYKPGSDAANKARENLNKAIELEPSNTAALASLAWLDLNDAQNEPQPDRKVTLLDRAANEYVKLGKNDAKAVYGLGVASFLKAHERLKEAREKLRLEPEEQGPIQDETVRSGIGTLYGEAIRQLEKALELDPASQDVMTFLNLCWLDRAELAASDEDRAHALAEVQRWSEKVRQARKPK